jgi:hypothetical protein
MTRKEAYEGDRCEGVYAVKYQVGVLGVEFRPTNMKRGLECPFSFSNPYDGVRSDSARERSNKH